MSLRNLALIEAKTHCGRLLLIAALSEPSVTTPPSHAFPLSDTTYRSRSYTTQLFACCFVDYANFGTVACDVHQRCFATASA